MSRRLEHPSEFGANALERALRAVPANQLLTGDCLRLLADIPDNSVDLIVTSPPYDNLRRYDTPAALDLLQLGRQLFRVIRSGGVCAVVIQDAARQFAKSLTSFRLAVDWCNGIGWRLFECCLYVRHATPGPWWNTRFRVDHEYILLFLKGNKPNVFHKDALRIPTKHAGEPLARKPYARRGPNRRTPPSAVQPLQCRGTVWRYAPSSAERNRIKLRHPATMPDALAADVFACFSNPGDLALDPLMGSGTTVVMAAKLGRRYLGIDASPTYVEIAKQRLAAEAGILCGKNAASRDEGTFFP